MSFWGIISGGFEEGFRQTESGFNTAVGAVSSGTMTAIENVGSGAVTVWRDASGGIVYGINWSKTSAEQAAAWTESVCGSAADFTVENYKTARTWVSENWQAILLLAQSRPPPLGPVDRRARDCMRYLLGAGLDDSLVRGWENDARDKGYTMAFDVRGTIIVSGGLETYFAAIQGTAFTGVYVDSNGDWGFLAGVGVGASLAVTATATAQQIYEVWCVFGDRTQFQAPCYAPGATVNIKMAPGVAANVGANVLLTPGFAFEGFRILVGASLSPPVGDGSGTSIAPSTGAPTPNLWSTGLAKDGPSYDAAVRVQNSPGDEAGIVATATATSLLPSEQTRWRNCSKCRVLFYDGVDTPPKPCAAGGTHDAGGSGRYVVFYEGTPDNLNGNHQADWRWCHKCATLNFGGNVASSKCPAGGAHSTQWSWNYTMVSGDRMQPCSVEEGWRWCPKCQSLFLTQGSPGPCAAGGMHDGSQGGRYLLKWEQNLSMPEQRGWRHCKKCQGLFHGANPASHCPTGGAHDGAGSLDYVLFNNSVPSEWGTTNQNDWRWCDRCQGLFYGGQPGPCPAPGGGAHSFRWSYNYVLLTGGADGRPSNAQEHWRWCNKCSGLWSRRDTAGRCPAGGVHDSSGSGSYLLKYADNLPNTPLWLLGQGIVVLHQGASDSQQLWHTTFDGVQWTRDYQIQCGMSESPSGVMYRGKLHCFHHGFGKNGQLWMVWFDGMKWSADVQVPCGMSYSPSAVAYRDKLYIFHHSHGSTGELYHQTYSGSAWEGDRKVPCGISDSPSAVVYKDQILVFHQGFGGNGELWHQTFNGSAWVGDTHVPCGMSGAPSAVVFRDKLYVFHQGYGADGHLYYQTWNGSAWEGDRQVPCGMSCSPSAVVYNDKLYVFHHGFGGSGELYYVVFDGTSWTTDVKVPLGITGSPGAMLFSSGT